MKGGGSLCRIRPQMQAVQKHTSSEATLLLALCLLQDQGYGMDILYIVQAVL